MKASVVILNYNGENHLRQFLPSVVAHTPAWAEIVVADNCSSDQSVEYLHRNFPALRVLELTENHGFAGGYNKALTQVEAEYYILLNSDVEVTEHWLDKLIERMDSMPDVTASQPKICDFTKREYFEYAGASGGYIDKYGYPFCRGRILSNCERDNAQYDETREVFWASGACMVIRAAAYHEAEGFDESLFAHMEEIDLCWRLKNQGHLIYCFPEVKVFHLGGGTLSAKRPKKTFLNFRNSLIVALKNDHRERLFQRLLKRLLLDGLGAFYLLITSGPSHFFAVVRAHFAFYMVFGKVRRTRRILKAKAHNRNHTGFYKRSIVLDYFLQGKKEFETLRSADFIL